MMATDEKFRKVLRETCDRALDHYRREGKDRGTRGSHEQVMTEVNHDVYLVP